MSLKAVKRLRHQGERMATIFKHLVIRKTPNNKQSKFQPNMTTPPLIYGTSLRIATQNVQSLAELLKHQAVLDLMRQRNLDLLILTETHSQSYYQFRSEGFFFIANGNKKDKYAGKEINQHSSRSLQITFA